MLLSKGASREEKGKEPIITASIKPPSVYGDVKYTNRYEIAGADTANGRPGAGCGSIARGNEWHRAMFTDTGAEINFHRVH